MSNNQPLIPRETNQQGSTIPKKVAFTKQLFLPRLNLGAEADQLDPLSGSTPPEATSPRDDNSANQIPSQTIPYTPVASDVTIPFKPDGTSGNFFGGINSKTLGSNTPDSTQSFSQNSLSQFDGSQTSTLNNAPQDMTTRQLENPGTGALMPPIGQYSGDTGMLTLNQAVKVVRIPVAGKPGEFKTGILPVIPQSQTGALPPPSTSDLPANQPKRHGKLITFVALIFLVLLGSGGYYLLHASRSTPSTATTLNSTTNGGTTKGQGQTASPAATAAAGATATAIANASLLVSDSLSSSSPIRDWARGEKDQINFAFKDGAYHIRQNGTYFGYALTPGVEVPLSYTYMLTMQLVNYDNTQGYAFFAMVLNYKSYSTTKATFYVFRVNISQSGNISYEFDKYDNRTTGPNDSPWKQLFPSTDNNPGNGKGNGKEFKGDSHSPQAYSVTDINGTFTLSVNGTKIGTVKDIQFTGGGLGMGVSQTKTEASFSNLSLYKN